MKGSRGWRPSEFSISSSSHEADGGGPIGIDLARQDFEAVQGLASIGIHNCPCDLNSIFPRLLAGELDFVFRAVSLELESVNTIETVSQERVEERLLWRGIPLEPAFAVGICGPVD